MSAMNILTAVDDAINAAGSDPDDLMSRLSELGHLYGQHHVTRALALTAQIDRARLRYLRQDAEAETSS
ncbi:hypothetical protein [Palleronia sp.]|uniref:hypothetical protein n=1 Tax=Palleronia sp. TaxID=1940284 RepID=UPI0035C7C853